MKILMALLALLLPQQPGDLINAIAIMSDHRVDVHGVAATPQPFIATAPTSLSINWITLTNCVIQIESIDHGWITNYHGQYFAPGVSELGDTNSFSFSAYGGTSNVPVCCLELRWPDDGATNYVQYSSNLVNWVGYPVELIGVTNWLLNPTELHKFYRLLRK